VNFSGPLTLTQVTASTWRVEREFSYVSGIDCINVPVGYVTDLASVPRPFRWLIPKSGGYNQAAVMHDYIYTDQWHNVPKSRADYMFYEAMGVLGVGRVKRRLMYWAVRINRNGGGW
jgi:hypothetical protein